MPCSLLKISTIKSKRIDHGSTVRSPSTHKVLEITDSRRGRGSLVEPPLWSTGIQSIQWVPSSQLVSPQTLHPDDRSHSIQYSLPQWLLDLPLAKRLLGELEWGDGRSSEVYQASLNITTSCSLSQPSDEVLAFLHLCEALEQERKHMRLTHQVHVDVLNIKLKKATLLSRDTTQDGSFEGQRIEETPNERQFPARGTPEAPGPPNMVAFQPLRPTGAAGVTPFAQAENETDGAMPTRTTPRHKDPSKFKFKCDTCPKSFTRSTTLQEHRRSHKDERRWACQLCKKAFVRLKDRNRHQAVHGEKKFECGVTFLDEFKDEWEWGCHRRFTREDGLISHLRTEKGWNCLKPLLYECWLFQPDNSMQMKERFRCEMTSNCCQEDFGGREQLIQHQLTPVGRKCVMEWIIAQIVGIYRGDPIIPSCFPSKVGGKQPRPSSRMKEQDYDSVLEFDGVEKDLCSPISTESRSSVSVA